MFDRSIRCAVSAAILSLVPAIALAQAPAANTPAPAAADQSGAAAQAAPQFSVNQNVGDWVVRCVQTTVKSPAPCEVLQVTVTKDNKQRLSSLSIAFVPSRDAYAMQVVVPTGVSLVKGLILGPSPNGLKFTRCERDGCYVEAVIDNSVITSLAKAGKSSNIVVVAYGKTDQIKFPVSLTGFNEAVDRMKSYSKDRAVALPPVPANGAATPAPAAAAAPARGKYTSARSLKWRQT